ncbi:transcriptional regulator, GntR family with aminotransferase domain [Desulfatibacillum aliphaticivorans]|uniref:HTH-type transcriptional regulator NorG n=1 Tax=Desulfatibacillum aliphaticivorans TaxID=218208 RepID=B8FBX8_DESAL|nr:PLP-dependent aminotransferase family protein [Desulfatibacillum aliphaticivorans]ACL05183.1 transcriptional regulator, GntR family with aminotransferase domain [Desulfatibacillum aliphaticivorans]
MPAQFQYVSLADEIQDKIASGQYRAGDRLPSLRKLHARARLSISTVYQAYIELEKRGLVESRNKSGFFVKARVHGEQTAPKLKLVEPVPKPVNVDALAKVIVEKISEPGIINLGGAMPDPSLLPIKQLTRELKSVSGKDMARLLSLYEHPAGNPELRREIVRRTTGTAKQGMVDEVIITQGCLEAVFLCLRAVAKPGDVIAVESPTFHGLLQLIEDLGMKALEIPTDPQTGISLPHLKDALDRISVEACVFVPTFQNPTGGSMPLEAKEELVELLGEREIPIIEDDIYGDLYFGETRPAALKSFDRRGMVLFCSSFSKTLSSGLRVGWTLPGKFTERVIRMKCNTNISSASLPQHVIAQYLKNGAYERHLRRLRNLLKNNVANMSLALREHFPEDAKLTMPQGGMLIWVELDERVDSFEVYKVAEKEGICFLPGLICSTSNRYRNCIRINCGGTLTPKVEKGIALLGQMIKDFRP